MRNNEGESVMMIQMTKCNLSNLELAQFNSILLNNEKIRRCPLPLDDYYVTSMGRIFSAKFGKIREMKQPKLNGGYHVVCLHFAGAAEMHYVHRLMMRAFYGIDTNHNLHTRHLDGDVDNNTLDNLALGTPKDNAEDRERHGKTVRGEKCGASKLNDKAVRAMRLLWEMRGQYNVPSDLTQGDLGRIWGVSQSTVKNVINRNSWKHIE